MRSLLLFLMACGNPAPELPRNDLPAAQAAAERFCTLLEKVGDLCTANGSGVTAGEHELSFDARVVEEVVLGSAATATWEYSASLDGQEMPSWTARASGSGSSLDEARTASAEEWARTYGAGLADGLRHRPELAVLQSLQDDQSPPPPFEVDGWYVYAGWTSLKGRMKERKPIRIEALLELLKPTHASWGAPTPDAWHTVTIGLSFRDGFAPEGECTLDGQPSDAVCAAVLGWDWPAPQGQYLVKQYLVYRAAPEPVAAPEQAAAEPSGTE